MTIRPVDEIDAFYPMDLQLDSFIDLNNRVEDVFQAVQTFEYVPINPIKLSTNWEMSALPNFASVSPTLYRGGLPTKEGFEILVEKGVKTLLTFRKLDAMRSLAQECGLTVIAMHWNAGDLNSITQEMIFAFLQAANDNLVQPLFMHCTYGADRTGFMSAVYRLVIERASMQEAIGELTLFQSQESEFLHPAFIDRLRDLDIQDLRLKLGLS